MLRGWWADVSHRLAAKTLIFLALIVALYWNQTQGLEAQTHRTCDAVNASNETLRTYIHQQLDRAEKTIPTLAYYKEHPLEQVQALNDIVQQRAATDEAFAPVDC